MKLFFSFLLRLIVIGFALIVSLTFSFLFIGFGLASGLFPELVASFQIDALFNDPDVEVAVLSILTIVIGLFASIQLFGLAVLPVTLCIALSELFRWQSIIAHLGFGGLCGLFVLFNAFNVATDGNPSEGSIIVSLACGFIGGFFYWLIAGRRAGNWLE